MLSPETSAEPGKWSTDRVAPMREIMDTFCDPATHTVVVMKPTQIGYTEAILNTIGFIVDVEPCPVLWLLPDQNAVDEMSKNRLTPMLRDTPRLNGKVAAPRSRDSTNTIAGKTFPGGRLAIVGSHAPSQLASRPIRVVIEDENDRFAQSAGAEGDPSGLAAKRQQWFWNRKTIRGSSPTVKGRSKIERDYKASDQRVCYVPCPHCSERQTLRWEQVKWDKLKNEAGKTVEHRPETAAYQCESCGVLWDDADRYDAIRHPEWRATAPFRGIAGFHLNQFYSPVVTLASIVTEFLTAYGRLPGTHPDVGKQIVFTNTVLAETWEEQGEGIDASLLANRGEPYGTEDLPDPVLFVTAGVDVQGDRLEVQRIGFGFGEETWVAAYDVIPGDPAQEQVWRDLDRLLLAPMRTHSGRVVRTMAACVDSGGHHAHQVHAFCDKRLSRRVFAIKGRAGPHVIWPTRASRTRHGNSLVRLVGVDTAKDAIYGRLKIKRREHGPSAGYIHFPAASPDSDAFGPDYFAQLTSEQAVTRYRDGRPYRVWELPSGRRNEALDTFVYALAARHALRYRLDRPVSLPSATASPTAEGPVDPEQAATVPVVAPVANPAAPKPAMPRPAAAQKSDRAARIAALAQRFR